MKKDLTNNIMQRVVRFERRRVKRWIIGMVSVALLGIGLFVFLSVNVLREMSNRQSWDLLTLFLEDPEIIGEYWRDTIGTLWLELPQKELLGAGLVLLIFLIWLFFTRKRRKDITSKLSGLARYHTK